METFSSHQDHTLQREVVSDLLILRILFNQQVKCISYKNSSEGLGNLVLKI